MTPITKELIAELTAKVDGLVQLEVGKRLPFVCLLVSDEGHMGIFTNRKSDDDVIAILETALEAAKGERKTWRILTDDQ